MVHASKPRLINRVLDAVMHLCEEKGSTARDILDFLRQTSKSTPRNLTMQVHRALKHAVNAGLLRHRSGRYKALFTLNPAPLKQLVNENNDERSVEGTSRFDTQPSPKKISSDDKEKNREKRDKQHYKRKRKRSQSRQRRRTRRSESRRRHNPLKHSRGMRELKYEEKEEEERLPQYNSSDRRIKPNIRNACRFSPNRERSKARRKGRTNYSIPPNRNYCDDKKAKVKRKTPARQECKYKNDRKCSKRSVSPNYSQQKQQSHYLQPRYSYNEDDDNGSSKSDSDDCKIIDRDDLDREPRNSESGSTL